MSVVGQQMKKMVGTAGKLFTALAEVGSSLPIFFLFAFSISRKGRRGSTLNEQTQLTGVNIEVISQGSSEINISCVVEASSADKAILSVHDRLILPFQTEQAQNN